MLITCTQEEKDDLIKCIDSSGYCPYTNNKVNDCDCKCGKCINKNWEWEIKNTTYEINAYYNGNAINYDNNRWEYNDNEYSILDGYRPCPKCGQLPTADSHDYCIAKLPGVLNACCGHGVEEGYIQFENGIIIRGYFKIEKHG